MQNVKTISYVTRTLAERMGLSINEVARRADLAPSTVLAIFRGEPKTIRRLTMCALAKVFGVSPEALESEAVLNGPIKRAAQPEDFADLWSDGTVPLIPAERILDAMSTGDYHGVVNVSEAGEKATQRVSNPPFPVKTPELLVATEVKRGMAMEPDVRVGDILYLTLQPTGYAPIYEELVLAMAPISRLPVVRRYGGDNDLMDADGRRVKCDRVLATVCGLARWDI